MLIDDHVVAYLQLNNLHEVHLGKCHSRIKVLETLAAGTTEEIQVYRIKFELSCLSFLNFFVVIDFSPLFIYLFYLQVLLSQLQQIKV